MNINVQQLTYRRAYVYLDGQLAVLLERSPFTGEYCYGEKTQEGFRPPFKPTRRKTALAAAKVAVREIGGK